MDKGINFPYLIRCLPNKRPATLKNSQDPLILEDNEELDLLKYKISYSINLKKFV